MGNNHDKYFGQDKRKILILGFPESGKTSILQNIANGKQIKSKTQTSKDLLIQDIKIDSLTVTFFVLAQLQQELSGGQRQRIFWKQHYDGTQGIIFVIDMLSEESLLEKIFSQIEKLNSYAGLKGIPLAICINKRDLGDQIQQNRIEKVVRRNVQKSLLKVNIFKTKGRGEDDGVKNMANWLLKQTKAL